MALPKHTQAMINYVSDFTTGNMSRMFFDLDYSYYVIERFPKMERENAAIAQLYADTVDAAYNQCSGKGNLECMEIIKRALKNFMEQVDGV